MPISVVSTPAETSFLAYLHYMEDLAAVIGGLYGRGPRGVYESLRLHPPVRALTVRTLDAATTQQVYARLALGWTKLAALHNAAARELFDRQANAVVPGLAVDAVVAAAQALAVAFATDEPADRDDAVAFLGDFVTEELLPYPWSAFCVGCPQTGSTVWGGSVLPGDAVSVFRPPTPQTSDARLATVLRTTRQRLLDDVFAARRRTDVKPGRTRRNLTQEHKEAIASSLPPTTIFDVLNRVRSRAEADDGAAFVEVPLDDEEAWRLADAIAVVADASVAAIEAVVAAVIGWDVAADLAAGHARRTAGASAGARAAALRAGAA